MLFDAALLVLMALVMFAFVLAPLVRPEDRPEPEPEQQDDDLREPVTSETQPLRDTS